MNLFEFLSSLAWPVVVFIAILKLQNPLSNLISTLAKIKYKDWEFEFLLDRKIDEIEKVVDSNIAVTEKKVSIPVVNNKVKQREKKWFNFMTRKDRYISIYKCEEELFSAVYKLFKMANIDESNDNLNEDLNIQHMINNLISKEFISKDLGQAILNAQSMLPTLSIANEVPGFLLNKYLENFKGIISILENKIAGLEAKESS
ncbi:hypothetical protein [Bacillus rugosus]|uniref:Uncharacterized protein n=1 Tax=Bacillus rugosus TaxID=2715209 RepID=A0ACD3ZV62_9BACI|nr:hypothetical protein [Bacillus rugosus]UPV77781.1 hypothetical protein M0696_13010 [Bacillus rugosus]